MPRIVKITLYKFDELSDRAKEKARDWYREGIESDEISGPVFEDAERIAAMLGIEFDQKSATTMGGASYTEPAIWWSGFSSQGDGACFEGRYAYAKGALAALKGYAPSDETLAGIAAALQQVQRANGYKLTATVKHSGHYYHPGCTAIEVMKGEDEADDAAAETVRAALRSFMDWIYKRLGENNDYLTSDEAIDESIEANDYDFEADGSRARHG
jgi:hypothetical protein